ncbi:MAG TPA: MBL fold metallo-hydrolase [Thermoanaerobaculia bacterium]|nr:MBL fold metallo-hydrolase [Thermoanaerobaculia bacterium]
MATTRVLADDIVKLYAVEGEKKLAATLFWGDTLRELRRSGGRPVFALPRAVWSTAKNRYENQTIEVQPRRDVAFQDESVLKVRFVDVGQGDGAVLETPRGQRILIDGGEGPWFRRYLRVAYAYVLRSRPLHCEAIVVSHGDADHYDGLTDLLDSRRNATDPLVTADCVFHNGLVKASGSDAKKIFGKTRSVGGEWYATGLVDDVRKVPETQLNRPFKAWRAALKKLRSPNGPVKVRRLAYGDDDAFDIIDDPKFAMKVLGPVVEEVGGKPALPLLHKPGSRSYSASHTVNGHSVVLKLTYGNVRFLFGADLNEESEERLASHARTAGDSLASEILKVPHHGSADFSPRMLEAVRPVVSVISSGDESTAKEYIHPRAGLVGALGKYSRQTVEKPLIYVTEMVAFFRRLKKAFEPGPGGQQRPIRNPYEKLAFGIVHVRTDGERVLVVTHSGKDDQKESYAFRVDPQGEITWEAPSII